MNEHTKNTLASLKAQLIRACHAGSPSAQYYKEEILSWRPTGSDLGEWVAEHIERPLNITPRTFTYYPPQPVCTAFWTSTDWERVAVHQTEPLVINALGKTWHATHRGDGGELYYSAD